MIRILPLTIAERLDFYHQDHLLTGWDELTPRQQAAFAAQIESVDFDQLTDLLAQQKSHHSAEEETPAQRAYRAKPPSSLVRLPRTAAEQAEWKTAEQRGEELLRAGQVGAILVAGGQGTRLGYNHPKGMYPLAPVSDAPLFQLLCEQLLARAQRAGHTIPYYIMTSDATHDETVAFFQKHRFFGLPKADVYFFQQGNMPAVDAQSGQLLLSDAGQLAMSPDGHGGLLQALSTAGLLENMQDRGIEYLYYHQVDNPLAIVCDPAYLGWHERSGAEVSTKVIAKRSAAEKMGIAVDVDGVTQIIEYSDLPDEVAERKTASGDLELWAGSTAIHVFSREFLERLANGQWQLPFHIAHKAVPSYVPGEGLTTPEKPNAYKFERFIFDILPQASKALIVEADRTREFNPLKNADGVHSPDDVRRSLVNLHLGWAEEAGWEIPEATPVEISSLVALDAAEFADRIGQRISPEKTDRGWFWS
ncbi:MAG: putative uridylyltransferase [Planctomycetaceae bacterium]|nr:putative uridylyltransferase [Planctomycetaceae bacterium]